VPENRAFAASLEPEAPDDWLILCGDVGEVVADVEEVLRRAASVWSRVIWVPGNHELWTPRDDPGGLRGQERYDHFVGLCRELGVVSPEDPYPVWNGVTVAPLFTLYDYSLGTGATKADSLRRADDAGVVCSDEFLLHPDPFDSIEAWADARLVATEKRLDAVGGPTVLVNHWPLLPELLRRLMFPEFALWCGSKRTADWHRRFDARAVVYGHLHIPRTTFHDGTPFEEVSAGYPREWRRRDKDGPALRRILPRR
jgi:3',5'-cyclic AMP phosphodiesterase CpdA